MEPSTTVMAEAHLHSGVAPTGLLTRLRRALGLEPPSREEIRRRMLSKPGILDSLSPETLEYLRTYDGPENLGPPLTERERRDLERRLSSSTSNPPTSTR